MQFHYIMIFWGPRNNATFLIVILRSNNFKMNLILNLRTEKLVCVAKFKMHEFLLNYWKSFWFVIIFVLIVPKVNTVYFYCIYVLSFPYLLRYPPLPCSISSKFFFSFLIIHQVNLCFPYTSRGEALTGAACGRGQGH